MLRLSNLGVTGFEGLAKYLVDLETLKCETPYHNASQALKTLWHDEDPSENTNQARTGIACTDIEDQSSVSKEKLRTYLEWLQKQSPSLWLPWTPNAMTCINYTIRSEHRFKGPWTGKTSHPIL